MTPRIVSAIGWFWRKGKLERDMDAELRYHIERETEENIRRGMAPEQARLTARRSLGGVEQIKEECRDARPGRALETTLQDIRQGLRSLRKNPGFTTIAIAMLALGIGANTAIFSVVYGVLLRPLPYGNGGRLVVLHQEASRANTPNVPFSVKEVFDYRDHNHTLDAVVEHHSMTFLLLGKDSAERVQTGVVSANFFEALGVQPLLGRTFLASDETASSNAVLILSYKYWKGRHGGDPEIVGKVFQMNNRPHTVIGVLPPIPQYPVENDVYMPTSQCPTRSSPQFIANRQSRMMNVFARLRPGVKLEQAQADLSTVASQMAKADPDVYPASYGYGIAATPLRSDLTNRARTTFLVLLGAAGFVLLIACANVANLLLARMLKREREIAVRIALGASRGRLVRRFMTESLLLSLGGGALGLLLAPWALALLVKFAERFTTRAAEVKMDAPVLLFTALVAVATGLLFGLAPAIASGRHVGDALKNGATDRTTASRGRERLRAALVVAQVAISFLLLIGAGLLIRSFAKMQQVDPGCRTDRLLTLRLTPSFTRYSGVPQLTVLWNKVLGSVRATPGVESAALATNFPFNPSGVASGPGNSTFEMEGRPVSKGELAPTVDLTVVSTSYFETIRQRLVRGRLFTEHDDATATPVGTINETMARHRWPGQDPLGKRVSFDGRSTWVTVIGVVGDAKEYGLNRETADEFYSPLKQNAFAGNLVLRTTGDEMSIAPLVRAALRGVDPQLAVDRVSTVESLRYDSVAPPRVTAALLGLFAALALAISAAGMAAVMALAVSQRTHELGIRMALGAPRDSIVWMVVWQGVALGLAGVALGSAGAVAMTRFLSSMLYAVSPTDALTFVAVSALFVAVAAAACTVPARQVTAIDPLIALRHD